MKRRFLILFFLCCSCAFCNSEMKLYWIPESDKKILIYTGDNIPSISEKIKKAKSANKVEKCVVFDGVYILEYEEKSFIIRNQYWIFETKNKKYLKTNLLENCRECLIKYFIKEKFGENLSGNSEFVSKEE